MTESSSDSKNLIKSLSFPFPSEWNVTNDRAIKDFNKCGEYYDDENEFLDHYKKGVLYHILCIILVVYAIGSVLVLLKFRKKYEIKKCNLSLIMLYSTGVVVNILSSYLNQVYIINNIY
ncbi:hypothetical protein PIROE2DRAFT_3661 [Piromyces sp. E2]|nr:hypothetical protein PIROE2DRAFT_3661 [Piromyces sp. E2]|eukprot:OUM68530.1 hypothetical protein PIROE2DRAFT_3661 [Piromyces sp. E2]